jgi:ABC-type amino acid transport substrate-binding protein
MIRLTMLCAAVLLCHGAAAAAAAMRCPAEVRASLPNFEIAPYVLGTDDVSEPPGLLVEWLRAALANSGCKPRVVIVRRPPNRQLAELASGDIDVLPGFSFVPNVDSDMVFPMKGGSVDLGQALLTDSVSLYARAGDTRVHWDGVTLRSPNPLVGSSTGGGSTAAIARTHGWTIESAPTPQADVRKLIAGRVDVILEPDVVVGPYLAGAEVGAVRRLLPPVRETHRYAPVSKKFQRTYPEFTARFWRELCRQSRLSMPSARACS